MADVFDELGEQKEQPQTTPKTAGRSAASPSHADVLDEAEKEMQAPGNQDKALGEIEKQGGDKWYQQRVDVSPEATPGSRFLGNIVGNPSLEELGQGAKFVARHPIDSTRMLLESTGEAQRGLWNRAKKEWQYPGIGGKADAAAHALESAVPFLGPSVARIGDQFASGDVAGGAGGVAGLTGAALLSPEARETATTPVRAAGRVLASPSGSRVASAAGGYAAGETIGHPWLGMVIGERMLRPLAEDLGGRLGRAGVGKGPRPLFDLSTGRPSAMVLDRLSLSDPNAPGPISVEPSKPAPYRVKGGPRDVIRPTRFLRDVNPIEGEYMPAEPPGAQATPYAPAEAVEPRALPPAGGTSVPRDLPYRRVGGMEAEDLNTPNPRVLARGGGIRTRPIGALPQHAGENADLAIGQTAGEHVPVQNAPHTLSGEGALRQILTGQDNQALLKIAKSRGVNVTKEAQLKPGVADNQIIGKIIDSFSPDELDEVGAKYLENTRMGRSHLGDIGPEAWKTKSLQTYFPDLKLSKARLARTEKAVAGARKAPPMAAPGEKPEEGDLTRLLQESLKRAKKNGRAAGAAAND